MTLRDVLRIAASTGDWITPYCMWLIQAEWAEGEIDRK